jgi:hypothetical protein
VLDTVAVEWIETANFLGRSIAVLSGRLEYV